MSDTPQNYKVALQQAITWKSCKSAQEQIEKALQGMKTSSSLSKEELLAVLKLAKIHIEEAIAQLNHP